MGGRNQNGDMTRRQFLIGGAAAAAGLGAARYLASRQAGLRVRDFADSDLSNGIAVIHATERDNNEEQTAKQMTRRAVRALGGMGKLVHKGDSVIIKPNIAWVRGPRFATNTNPWVVAALVEMCLEAGAGRVRVMDNTISKNPAPSYSTSGIADAARAAGADVPYVDRSRAVELDVPDPFVLKRWPFCREFVDADTCDVLINAPILKDHGTSRLTIGLKNAFGMIAGERGQLHRQIHHKIPDLHRVLRVDLTVMDAYRVLRTHGPTGGTLEDVDDTLEGARRVVAGRDRVAVDAYGAHMFDLGPDEVGFIKNAAEAELGTADWRTLDVTEETI